MSRFFPAIIFGLSAGLLRLSFFESLPAPLSYIDPILILAIMYVAGPAGEKAFAVGLAAGAVADALSSLPFGTYTLAYTAGIGMSYLLFNGVFTSHDWPGILMISTAGYLTVSAAYATIRAVSAIIGGDAVLKAFTGDSSIASVALALGTQLVAMILVLIVASRIRSRRDAWRP